MHEEKTYSAVGAAVAAIVLTKAALLDQNDWIPVLCVSCGEQPWHLDTHWIQKKSFSYDYPAMSLQQELDQPWN